MSQDSGFFEAVGDIEKQKKPSKRPSLRKRASSVTVQATPRRWRRFARWLPMFLMVVLGFGLFKLHSSKSDDPVEIKPRTRSPLSFTLPASYTGFSLALKENLKYSPNSHNAYAYVFYASDPNYACSALINVHRLRQVGADPSIDFLIIYPKGTLDQKIIDRAEAMGVKMMLVEDMPRGDGHNGYYHYANVKLRVFQLYQYERVIFLDSDTMVLKNLDHLFLLPRGIGLAAPRVYWIKDQEFTSTMLVIEPSEKLWGKIDKELHPVKPNHFDMDILNDALGRDCMILPNIYGLLNSHWENKGDTNMGNLDELKENAFLAHFTAVGKPWSHDWKTVGSLRPQHHPFFVELWKMWWDTKAEVGCFDIPNGQAVPKQDFPLPVIPPQPDMPDPILRHHPAHEH